MTKVTIDQFEVVSDVRVRHKPTGAVFSTHRYDDPEHVEVARVNWGSAGAALPDGHDFDRDEVMEIARQLLRKQAKKR